MYLIRSHLLQYFHSECERQQDWPALWWWLQRVVSSAGGMACAKATCFHFRGAAECCFVMAETVSDVQIVWKHVKTIPWYHVIRTESVYRCWTFGVFWFWTSKWSKFSLSWFLQNLPDVFPRSAWSLALQASLQCRWPLKLETKCKNHAVFQDKPTSRHHKYTVFICFHNMYSSDRSGSSAQRMQSSCGLVRVYATGFAKSAAFRSILGPKNFAEAAQMSAAISGDIDRSKPSTG